MDEPQVSSQVEETEASTDKSDFNAVLASAFVEEIEKPMDVDTSVSEAEPSTSADVAIPEPSTEAYDVFAVPAPVDNDEDAGQSLDESMSVSLDEEVSESVEHIIMEKPESELDETLQSTVEGDTLDFTEASINISQLNVEHNDDSNDAFNALKESEIDVLETPKEEIEEPKEIEEEPEEDAVPTPTDALEETVEPSVDAEDSVPTPAPMETDDIDEDKETEPNAELNEETCHELGLATDTADLDADLDAGGIGETSEVADKPDAEETEDITEDDGTTETTNEGEGIDENVCLLGDETDVAETEKDAASQNEETPEEEDQEATPIDADAADDVVEGDEAGKETEEPEEAEEAEPMEVELIAEVLKENEIREISGELTEESCLNCENSAKCPYKVLEESGDIKFLCSFNCVKEHREDNPDKYTVSQKQVVIQEILPAENVCAKCAETKSCKYRYKVKVSTTVTKDPPALAEGEEPPEEPPQPTVETVQSIEEKYLCEDECQKAFVGDNSDKYLVKEIRKRAARVREPPKRLEAVEEQEVPKIVARSDAEVEAAKLDRDQSFIRRCGQCFDVINFNSKSLQWETSDFCNEKCLGSYQNLIGAACSHCNQAVTLSSIGKLCVRFGPDIHQFCTTQCLNDFKKCHQPCSYCSKNLKNSSDEYIGRKRGNFCDDDCARRYEEVVNPKKKLPPYLCSVCNIKKSPKVEVLLDGNIHRFCSNPCFSAFKFVNNVAPDQCDLCSKYFERKLDDSHTIFQANAPKIFCTRICMSIFISKARVIQQCNWCKVSKYNFDMVLLPGDKRMCSLNCLSLHEVSVAAVSRKRSKCDHCHQQKQPQYHLTMSDASIRSFCTYQCVMAFQNQITKSRAAGDIPDVVPAGTAKRIKPASTPSQPSKAPVISIVHSGLGSRRSGRQPYNPIMNRRTGSPIPVPELTVQLERLSDLPPRVKVSSLSSLTGGGSSSWTPISHSRGSSPVRVEHKTQVVTIPPLPKQVGNKSTMCKSITLNKAISCVPSTAEAECQTEDWLEQRIILPVPIILFVPQPMMMYNMPTPIAVPIPLPIPVPVFVPTTRNSAQGIMKEIKKIQDKMPTDPYEAELLMMAEMVAGDKKREETDSNSDENNEIEYGDGIEQNSSFNEDLVQIAFKMAGNDFDDPSVDLENEMTASTISQSSNAYDVMDPHSSQHHQLLLLQQQREAEAMQSNRGRKRMQPQPKIQQQTNNRNSAPNKRIKREMEVMQSEIPREPTEKPDANMCLKYTFGVNAWKQWVATKNADFEKSSIRRKPIKSEILQLTADELNYSLCMFVKEVRKPNSSEYAPDTIYYLVLGIQQYLYENGRIDNIFTDRYYEQFTDCLDEVAKKFSVLYNDSQYIVTRVEEEHLWECKQLGAHSPHVLLSTLMFFNTKHFNLVTVDEHMELSFSHIMKHWKRNPNQPGAAKLPGSRNVLLRFYPPQSSLEANSRKKKVYEQQENEENPLRCPVKLYEFYLSKCPESVKTRNDVFYLQPERSCVPDSPVWYSTQPLSRDALSKMLHRVKMVKEINIALLTS